MQPMLRRGASLNLTSLLRPADSADANSRRQQSCPDVRHSGAPASGAPPIKEEEEAPSDVTEDSGSDHDADAAEQDAPAPSSADDRPQPQ